jgi:hypothetical protein
LALHELEGLLKEYTPLMSGSMERAVEKGIKYGAVFAEVSSPTRGNEQDIDTFQLNPIAKAVFGVASVTFEVRALYLHIRGRGNA